MSESLTPVLLGLIAIHIGFLYIFSVVYQWAWFYQGGRNWSPYYIIGHDNTMALFKAFGVVCYGCGFIFVAGTLVQREMWLMLAGLIAHSAGMLYAVKYVNPARKR